MEIQDKDVFKNFISAMEEINSLLRNLPIQLEKDIVRHYVEHGTEFAYTPDYTIFFEKKGIAELYDLSNEENKGEVINRTFYNAQSNVDKPYYIFFFENDKWFGLHLYTSNSDKQEISWSIFDPLSDFTSDIRGNLWETSSTDIVRRVAGCNPTIIDNGAKEDLCNSIRQWFDNKKTINKDFRKRVIKLVTKWEKSSQGSMFRIKQSNMALRNKFEQELFMAILGKCTQKQLYRFTSKENICYLLNDKTHAMSSIVCMNDKSEGYYADEYISNSVKNNCTKEKDEDFRNVMLKMNKDYFITSLTKCTPENLTMWRLYGENGKGIVIEYLNKLKRREPYCFLAPVSYQQDNGVHEELDFVKFLFREKRIGGRKLMLMRWNIWQMFFKSKEFKIEEEVRLLWSNAEAKVKANPKFIYANGILSPQIISFSIDKDKTNSDVEDNNKENQLVYPLTIKKIILGPLFNEAPSNASLGECYFQEIGLPIEVETSKIGIYRNN